MGIVLNYRMLAIVMLLLTAAMSVPTAYSDESTIIYVNPKDSYLFPGESFNITVSVINVTNLNHWQVGLNFDPNILYCTEVTIPADNIFASYPTFHPPPIIDNSDGLVVQFLALDGTQGVDGSGILMQIKFVALNLGSSNLNFTAKYEPYHGTCLWDPDDPPEDPSITFESINGTVDALPPAHPFNVTKNGQTYTVVVFSNSTVIDAFNFNETANQIAFNATGPDGTIGYTCVSIPKALLNGTYFVGQVNHEPVPITRKTQNDTHTLTWFNIAHSTKRVIILTTGPGDINGDRKVDIKDIATVALAYGSYPGHEKWDPIADITGPAGTPEKPVPDGKVDIRDVAFVARNFGKIY